MAILAVKNLEIVSVHDEKTELGPAYQDFDLVQVPGTPAEIEAAIKAALPPTKLVFRSKVADAWTFAAPEMAEVWADGKDYKLITERPAHMIKMASVAGIKTIKDLKSVLSYNLGASGKNDEVVAVTSVSTKEGA